MALIAVSVADYIITQQIKVSLDSQTTLQFTPFFTRLHNSPEAFCKMLSDKLKCILPEPQGSGRDLKKVTLYNIVANTNLPSKRQCLQSTRHQHRLSIFSPNLQSSSLTA